MAVHVKTDTPPVVERWYGALTKDGQYVPLFPKRMPLCDSRAEVYDRVRIIQGMDQEFRTKWRGWLVVAVDTTGAFKIGAKT